MFFPHGFLNDRAIFTTRSQSVGIVAHINSLNSILTQLEGNQVDLTKEPFIQGPRLTFDPTREQFTGTHAEEANALVRKTYREGYAVPEEV